ncbi:MAG: ATP-binding protein [Melioribacteraceae bacterium]|nr:ATP-binding protein [Melioribacteraceae bacterium]MCF8355864.1 ATP-binding protein [Melioribacteraceae bacterium]MCF8393294.1 ATP-binding protein [Melioribacteraceae bacterium]MCF8419146.1 ATP-binding protein [Melioribacteraceae bacterium]
MSEIWFSRYYEKEKIFRKGKVTILEGPRRVGKTELVRKILSGRSEKIFTGSGDNFELQEIFSQKKLTKILNYLGGYDIVFIDEAQKITDVGAGLKLLVDNSPETIIIATGSASFDLSNKVGEPLTGRQIKRILFPVSILELTSQFDKFSVKQRIDEFLVFGSYPEVLGESNRKDQIEYLLTLRDSYLLKDILELDNVRYAEKLFQLLKLLAFQIGNEVSLNELSNSLGISKQSVERYLYLLEKAFIIKKVGGFSRNLRKEITKSNRYYFWDNGIRNAVINNFNELGSRDDTGMLWENLMFIERLKTKEYKRMYRNDYFWRTYDQKEIDLVEEGDGKLFAFEFKYNKTINNPPKLWTQTYGSTFFACVSKENFFEFLL